MLSDRDIRAALWSGDIKFSPDPEDKAFQPASVDVRMGANLIHQGVQINVADTVAGYFPLYPMQFVLAELLEEVEISSSIVCRVEGKSSLGRKGLGVHITAGFVDPGWHGRLTMELYNFGGDMIHLTPGMYIAQLAFDRLDTPAMRPYGHKELGSHYQGSDSVRRSADVL